jgi:integrase
MMARAPLSRVPSCCAVVGPALPLLPFGAIGVDVPSSSRVPIRPLNASQAAALLEAVRGHRLAPLYDLVFPSEVGTVIMARNLVRHFKATLQRAGLSSSFRFHDLRHTAATLMLAAGVPLKTVSDILGHSSIQVTADTYGYTFEEDKQRALDTLAQALGKKPEVGQEKQGTPPEDKQVEPPSRGK